MKKILVFLNILFAVVILLIGYLYLGNPLEKELFTEHHLGKYIDKGNPLEHVGNFAMISISFFFVLMVTFFMLKPYKLQQKIMYNIEILFVVGYYIFLTPHNGAVLETWFVIISLTGCLGIYLWMKFKKEQPNQTG